MSTATMGKLLTTCLNDQPVFDECIQKSKGMTSAASVIDKSKNALPIKFTTGYKEEEEDKVGLGQPNGNKGLPFEAEAYWTKDGNGIEGSIVVSNAMIVFLRLACYEGRDTIDSNTNLFFFTCLR